MQWQIKETQIGYSALKSIEVVCNDKDNHNIN